MKPAMLLVLPLVAALTSCAPNDAAPATAIADSTRAPSAAGFAPLPAAVGTPTLVLHPAGASSAGIALDLAGLVAMSTRTVEVHEPFLKKTLEFTGVPLQELLNRAGISTGSVHFHALDDYTFDAKVSDLTGALLATSSGGAAIEVADGGPVRIIFEAGSSLAEKTDAWVWSVDTMSQVSLEG